MLLNFQDVLHDNQVPFKVLQVAPPKFEVIVLNRRIILINYSIYLRIKLLISVSCAAKRQVEKKIVIFAIIYDVLFSSF